MPFALGVLLVCLCTYSVVRAVAVDVIGKPIRDRVTGWADDGKQALDAHKSPKAIHHVAAKLDELILCPWCLSAHVGMLLALGWWWALPSLAAPAFWVPVVGMTARIATGILTLFVAWLERLAEGD